MIEQKIIINSLKNGCPKCGTPNIFPHRFTLTVREECPHCGLKIADHDSGDGPAFFLLSSLCIVLTPLALWLAAIVDLPLWAHAVIWTGVSIGFCLITLQPLKSYFIVLNYKHRDGAKGV